MKFLFLMDPLEKLIFEKDTTLMLMIESHKRGHEVYFLPQDGISLIDGKVFFNAIKVTAQYIEHEPILEERAYRLSQDEVQAVFIRKDPPFDAQYLMNTWMLDHLPENVCVINSSAGVRTVNEKVWSAQFTGLVPPTIVSADKDELLNFARQQQNVIAKPTDGFGGQSIFHIEQGHTNTNVILETLSDRYSNAIILQKYVSESRNGDKRILLLNGEVLGALLRVHGEGDHRNNFYAGGKPQPTIITPRDQKIVDTLKPHLQKLGLYLTGIDILGDYLIEVNVTSPTCLQEMNRLYDVHLEEKVIAFVEKLIK